MGRYDQACLISSKHWHSFKILFVSTLPFPSTGLCWFLHGRDSGWGAQPIHVTAGWAELPASHHQRDEGQSPSSQQDLQAWQFLGSSMWENKHFFSLQSFKVTAPGLLHHQRKWKVSRKLNELMSRKTKTFTYPLLLLIAKHFLTPNPLLPLSALSFPPAINNSSSFQLRPAKHLSAVI